jgi:flagellar biosynthesis/type III secretory pathway protein FliH
MSKLIKAGSNPPAGVRRVIVEAPVYDAKMEAERLIAESRAEAERALADATQEAERLRTKAHAVGRERGLAAVTELLVGARAAAARSRGGAESELRALAVRIAEKILGRELALRPDAITDVVLEALRHAGDPREVVVRVSPDDLAALERGKPRLMERCASARAVTFRADESVGRGGCVIDTELGVVDARLSTQLEAIERALRGEHE